MIPAASGLAAVCVLTFVHHAAAQMRTPVLPLHAAAHGATPTGVGAVVAVHMAVAAAASIPLGRAADVWSRRALLLGGTAATAVTSLLFTLAADTTSLVVVNGLAGIGIAAFTPSAMSMIADAAPPGSAGRAYSWYATAHYSAIGIGSFAGGLVAGRLGDGAAFVASAAAAVVALGLGLASPLPGRAPAPPRRAERRRGIGASGAVWAGWVAAGSALVV